MRAILPFRRRDTERTSTMCLRNLAHEGKAEANSLRARGDEWFEDVLGFRFGHAGPAVADEKATTILGAFHAERNATASG